MSWVRARRGSSPLTSRQFAGIMQDAIARNTIDLEEAIRLASRVVDRDGWVPDVAWMAATHASIRDDDPFLLLRLRELAGVVVAEHDDDYVLAMISSLGGVEGARSFLLSADDGLRNDIFWRIFEVEGGGEVSLANVDRFTHGDGTWQDVVTRLVGAGILPRTRVLRSCLEALRRDFSSYTAGWFSRLYLSLEPTLDETAALESDLLALLASRVSANVTLAVSGLRRLHERGLGETEGLIANSGPALLTGKANSLAVLKMLDRIAASTDDTRDVANEIAIALDHPHPDVRIAAQRTLQKLGRGDLIPAVGQMGHVEFVDTRATRPDTESRVIPWSEDEVVERFASVLAGNADGIEFELALATLATLEDRSALAPLLKTARRRTGPTDWPRPGPMSAMLMARLLMDAFGEDVHVDEWDSTDNSVLGARTSELGRSLRSVQTAGVLLATPDERGGWLHPITLVDRVKARDAAGLAMPVADLVGALLRLSMDGRSEALQRLPDQPRSAQNVAAFAAIAYALGGERRHIDPVEWWIAASRSRAPFDDDDLLIDAGHGEPGAGTRASAVEEWLEVESAHSWEPPSYKRLRVKAGPAHAIESLRPTCVPSTGGVDLYYEWKNTRQIFGELVFPHDADVTAVLGYQMLVQGLESATEYGQAELLDGLSRHPGAWGPLAASALVLGLSQQPAQSRIHASELFAQVVPTKLAVAEVAAAFARHAPGCTATRWASSLADAATISPGAERAVADTLAAVLPQLPFAHRGMDKLLDVLLSVTERDADVLSTRGLSDWLREFSGSSRSARAARTLIGRVAATPV